MTLCAACTNDPGEGNGELCRHHAMSYSGHDWAAENRMLCDFFHRRIPLPRYRGEDAEPIPHVEALPCA